MDAHIILLSFISILILFYRYPKQIEEELSEFTRSKFSLTFGIFLATISLAFVAQTNNTIVIAVTTSLMIIAFMIILIFILRYKNRIKV